MPNRAGRLTSMERAFVRTMAKPHTSETAASAVGYSNPRVAGWKLMKNDLIANAVRSEARKFLDEKAGPAAVYNLAEIMLDTAQPAGARVKASEILGKWSGMAGDADGPGKELHEMTADELRDHIARMETRRQAMERALADQSRPVLEHERSTIDEEQEDIPNPGVFD